MAFNCSFGEINKENEGEVDNVDYIQNDINNIIEDDQKQIGRESPNLFKMLNNPENNAENEISLEKIIFNNSTSSPRENDIFNPVFAQEIENDNNSKEDFYQNEFIKENINYHLKKIFIIIQSNIIKNKTKFFYDLKFNLDKKYTNFLKAELLMMNFDSALITLVNRLKFKQQRKILKYFNKLRIYSMMIKTKKEEEKQKNSENENKIKILNDKLSLINTKYKEIISKVNETKATQNKLIIENNDIEEKVKKLENKYSNLIREANILKENLSKLKLKNNINNNNGEKISNLQNIIEQKENEKDRTLNDVDDYCQSMDKILSQFEIFKDVITNKINSFDK